MICVRNEADHSGIRFFGFGLLHASQGHIIAVLVGQPAEARLVERIWGKILGGRLHIMVCGGRADAVRRAMEKIIALAPEYIISVGVASGLVAGLTSRNVLLAGSIVLSSGDLVAVNPGLLRRAVPLLKGLKPWQGPLAGLDRMAHAIAEKNSLHAATAAWAADCQCAVAVLEARRADVPLLLLRGIVDDAESVLPAPLRAVWQQGAPEWLMVLLWCVFPFWWWRYRQALKSLSAALSALIPFVQSGPEALP